MSATEAWDIIKTDWYGLDQRYVRDNPASLFWRVFLPARIPISPIPFLPQKAFNHQMNHIKDYYANPDSALVLERPFPYLNEKTMSKFVDDSTNSILKILSLVQQKKYEDWMESSVELLSPAEREPFPPPLGDVIA